MRIGHNPQKDKKITGKEYLHQVIIPVYIPNQEGYFKESLKILKVCLDSLIATMHEKIFISVVDNGSCEAIGKELDSYYKEGKIQEVLHTGKIGKLNAILKGIVGRDFPLVTIADADILFKPGWQKATIETFNAFPKAGMVGLIPQYNMFSNFCTNILFDTFFNNNARFYKVEQPQEMRKFYHSLGWKMEVDHPYLQYAPGIKSDESSMAYIGSSHVVATYRKELFTEIPRFFKFKMGGSSERYLDELPIKKDLWKLTTFENYAYHMGNVWEEWMEPPIHKEFEYLQMKKMPLLKNYPHKNIIKNKIFKKLLRIHKLNQLYFRYKKLPKNKIDNYSRIFY